MIDADTKRNIRYVRFDTNQGIGYGCFVIDWAREDNELIYTIGSSFCNPKDSFSKPRARQIAEGRAITNYQCGGIQSDNVGFITDNDFNNMLNELFYKDVGFSVIPNWARKAFNRGRYHLSLRGKIDILHTSLSMDKLKIQTPTARDLETWKAIFAETMIDSDFSIIISDGKNHTPVKIPR